MPTESELNQEKNKLFYEQKYSSHHTSNILIWLQDPQKFITAVTKTETSWFGLYQGNFQCRLAGKKVLELGCGDCTNAAIMAALGADVHANDIASSSGNIIEELNEQYEFQFPITFIEGDFLKNEILSHSFDYIVGKAFLHHLTLPTEQKFLSETSRLLKEDGEARFFEPAVNNKLLDLFRWIVPVPGRPSIINKSAFLKWKENDPHPDRSFSSSHFINAGRPFFKTIKILPVGSLERFHRLLPRNRFNKNFRQWALKKEKYLPNFVNRNIARSQLIIYRHPVH